jgi:hypothetical protein
MNNYAHLSEEARLSEISRIQAVVKSLKSKKLNKLHRESWYLLYELETKLTMLNRPYKQRNYIGWSRDNMYEGGVL